MNGTGMKVSVLFFKTQDMMRLIKEEVAKIDSYVESLRKAKFEYTAEQRDWSYQQWNKGAHGWDCIQQGGTGIMLILLRYHHSVMPFFSKEWRPSIIIREILQTLKTQDNG